MIASVSSYVVPALLSCIVVAFVYLLGRRQHISMPVNIAAWPFLGRIWRKTIDYAVKGNRTTSRSIDLARGADATSQSTTETAPTNPLEPVDVAKSWDWDTIFLIDRINGTLKLRVLPDTDQRAKDAGILLLFGYKIILGKNYVKSSILNNEIKRALAECPNRLLTAFDIYAGPLASINVTDYGSVLKDSGYAERNRLLEGGFLELTMIGERHARMLAYEAIRRA